MRRAILMLAVFAALALAITGDRPEAVQAEDVSYSPPAAEEPGEPAVDVEAKTAPWANEAGVCTVTYYDVCAKCCGKADGITASGAVAVPYETCAVDPAVIPLGSTVLVDFGDGLVESYRAEDVGGGVDGNHIDICVASHEEALNLGVREADVYWLPANQEPEKQESSAANTNG